MSDIMRTALKGGGGVRIAIDANLLGDFTLRVTEDWGRLTAVEQTAIPAQRLDKVADPDGLIQEEAVRLVRRAHMNWEAHRMTEEARNEQSDHS